MIKTFKKKIYLLVLPPSLPLYWLLLQSIETAYKALVLAPARPNIRHT